MHLTIIIVNYNVFEDVKLCIASIYRLVQEVEFEIIVVDNNSTDRGIVRLSDHYPDIKLLLLNENKGFGAANNEALRIAKGRYFLFVNPDIIFEDNTPKVLMEFLDSYPKAGAAGPMQEKPGAGTEYYYSFFPGLYSRFMQEFGLFASAPYIKRRFSVFWDQSIAKGIPFRVDWIIGSCLMLRREVYETVGGFDEAFFLYEEEVELLFRMKKAGWSSFILPQCKVVHNHHSSTYRIGLFFVLYHEYRSRIVFSAKRYRFPVSLLRSVLTISSILFRFLYYSFTDFRSAKVFSKRLFLYLDLVKLTLISKKKLLSRRFNFDSYKYYFADTGNAKL